MAVLEGDGESVVGLGSSAVKERTKEQRVEGAGRSQDTGADEVVVGGIKIVFPGCPLTCQRTTKGRKKINTGIRAVGRKSEEDDTWY